jgi:hypothetical protein
MAKWRLLHLVGGDVSVWTIGQIKCQYRLLPAELFEQRIAVGEIHTASLVESQLLVPVTRLARQFEFEYSAARNLARVIRKFNPDIIVCWDISATEQLKSARLGRRKVLPSVLMMFDAPENRVHLFKLKSNYHSLALNLICANDAIGEWAKSEIAAEQRTMIVKPVFERSMENISKSALRRKLGFTDSEFLIYISADAKIHDFFQVIIACGILEKLYPNVRIILGGIEKEKFERAYAFSRNIIPPIMTIIHPSDIRQVLGASDVVINPYRKHIDTLLHLETMGRKLPFISPLGMETAEGEPLFIPITKNLPQAYAAAVYKLMNDVPFRSQLAERGEKFCQEFFSETEYQSSIIKSYQKLLNVPMLATVYTVRT